jgi:hypothetical protein
MTPDCALLVGFMTVALTGPSVLPLIDVPVLRWIGRICRIFVLGATWLEFDRLDCLLVAAPPEGCGVSFGVYDIDVPLLLVGAPPDATGCELVGVYDG